jgi:phage N-6-adenine-methyltransferase
LLDAVEARFGPIVVDLACTESNKVCINGYAWPETNSLEKSWPDGPICWLNPEFANIGPWVKKASFCWHQRGWKLVLVPASVGSEWFRIWVRPFAYTLFLNPRVTFVGEQHPYPKDLLLACYGSGVVGSEVWRWKEEPR